MNEDIKKLKKSALALFRQRKQLESKPSRQYGHGAIEKFVIVLVN